MSSRLLLLTRLPAKKILQGSLNAPRRWHSTGTIPPPTPVEKIIVDNIKATGPISLASYMQLCLSHPTHGYYMNAANPVFGTQGDFITSPEISQVFGELIGVWFLSQWANAGSPPNIRLVELGPGRGTLMDDILRVIAQLRPPSSPINVHLVETSQTLRAIQDQKLRAPMVLTPPGTLNPTRNINLHWHTSITDVPYSPDEYTMLVAHEFFDALPIHLLQKKETGWHEVMIDLARPNPSSLSPSSSHPTAPSHSSNSNNTPQNPAQQQESPTSSYPRLRRALSPTPTAASTLLGLSSPRFAHLPIGSFAEVSPTGYRIARKIAELLAGVNVNSGSSEQGAETSVDGINAAGSVIGNNGSVGGCGLIVDYGDDHLFGDSFRAFKNHKIVDVFHRPGECDLTANVDFAYLKEAMTSPLSPISNASNAISQSIHPNDRLSPGRTSTSKGNHGHPPLVITHGPISQRHFLSRMGLDLRLDSLLRSAHTPERKKAIRDAAARLTDATGMGEQYKVLGISALRKWEGIIEAWPFDVGSEGFKGEDGKRKEEWVEVRDCKDGR